jgi:hypothetical protein
MPSKEKCQCVSNAEKAAKHAQKAAEFAMLVVNCCDKKASQEAIDENEEEEDTEDDAEQQRVPRKYSPKKVAELSRKQLAARSKK